MVSMHLLVLSAFRPGIRQPVVDHSGVSMHLLVLSAFRLQKSGWSGKVKYFVSMHLLVLSAFRLVKNEQDIGSLDGFNAPSGAQCFPTILEAESDAG